MLAAKLSFISLCLEQHLEEDVDLVFLEYQPVGSWALKDEYYAALERLVRKVSCSLHWPCANSEELLRCRELVLLAP
jgi:hypothetical protein